MQKKRDAFDENTTTECPRLLNLTDRIAGAANCRSPPSTSAIAYQRGVARGGVAGRGFTPPRTPPEDIFRQKMRGWGGQAGGLGRWLRAGCLFDPGAGGGGVGLVFHQVFVACVGHDLHRRAECVQRLDLRQRDGAATGAEEAAVGQVPAHGEFV